MLELTPGTLLGGTWELQRPLGQGGMGAVWVAGHARLPKCFAVKVLHDLASDDVELLARFRREAEIACRLDHPHIVQVVDFNVESGSPFIVMELLRGADLASRLTSGRLNATEACVLIRQVASALEAAHAESVVHRDLTPRNIFLMDEEVGGPLGAPFRVKVLDFGISKVLGGSTVRTAESAVMGTPAYMAPEQARGEQAAIGPRTDQFALGVVMYEALGGVRAFDGDSVPSVLYRVVHEVARPLRELTGGDITAAMLAAIDRAMAKDPADRHPSVTAFADAFTGDVVDRTARATGPVSEMARTLQGGVPSEMDVTLARPATQPAAPATQPAAPATQPDAPAGMQTGLDRSQDEPRRKGLPAWALAGSLLLLLGGGYAVIDAMSATPDASVDNVVAAGDSAKQASPRPGAANGPDTAVRAKPTPDATPARPVDAQASATDATGAVRQDAATAKMPSLDASASAPDVAAVTLPKVDRPAKKSRKPPAKKRRSAAKPKPPPVPDATDEGEVWLAKARAALSSGKGRLAEEHARKALRTKVAAARELLAKAKCHQRDGPAAAGFVRRLSKKRGARVKKYCRRKFHMELPL